MSEIFLKNDYLPPVNLREICRYAGAKLDDERLVREIEKSLSLSQGQWRFGVCYRFFDVKREGEILDLGFAKSDSSALLKVLADCHGLLLFAATVGPYPDRMALRYGSTDPYRALVYSAIGSERVESLCDLFAKDMAEQLQKEGCFLTPRFSPGYGDLPLSLQKEIFLALMPQRYPGITLNDSLLMWPCKSVTAIMGIGKKK